MFRRFGSNVTIIQRADHLLDREDEDVTEENKQKQAADEKINNLNAIPTPILSVDTDFTITYMNPAGAAIANMTPDEVIGKKCYDLFKTPHCKTEKLVIVQLARDTALGTPATGDAEVVSFSIDYTTS